MPGGGEAIDEETLQAVAEATGGRMFRARDAAELAGIYAEIDRIEPVERPAPAARPRIERYAWPLGAALACAALLLLPGFRHAGTRTAGWRRRLPGAAP